MSSRCYKKHPQNNPGLEQSRHWKRVDVRQKKITRGLSSLSKEFILSYLSKFAPSKQMFFKTVDLLLKEHFPYIFRTQRIQALGGLGKIVLMSKFESAVKYCAYLSKRDKAEILRYGNSFTEIK
uniref:Uncharacterized protein n=1 Tax=Euplotes harpa TaxID=151035 RepID=A0A7S3JGM2_9SPIT|mmetsp:Transcript_39429/g.45270  ORF Transcript_39429/g.45270 Transcript_39429/m.45270 type:complete len:124 (+) Transcript_39429:210-581(+)